MMVVQVSVLSNGLRVATDPMTEAESVVIGVWVAVGTRHEPWRASGVAHLVEHMMFKGTKKRSAFELSALIEQNGGMINAHTSREETAYYARVLPEDAPLAVDILSDMLLNSKFDQKDLEKERQVVIQEIGRERDTPEDYVFDLLFKTAFPDQRMGRSILGSEKVIANLPRAEVLKYVKQHYNASNMVVVGAGKISHQEMVRMAQKAFGKLLKGSVSKAEKAKVYKGDTRLKQDSEQLHFVMAFPGPGRKKQDVYAAHLLGIVLGGGASSRLFQKVREERGLVYAISASHSTFQETGLFGLYAGTDPARVGELIPVICDELRKIGRTLKSVELERAKAQVRADYLMGQESVMRRADVLGHQMIAFGKPRSIRKILEKVEAVSMVDVRKMADKIFQKAPIVTALGPVDAVESYARLSARLKK